MKALRLPPLLYAGSAGLLAKSLAIGTLFLGLGGNAAIAAECRNMQDIQVPGAVKQQSFCLEDLSTKYLVATGHTDINDWISLHSQQSKNPAGAVPGIQIDGHFPDTSRFNTYHNWNSDAQFVIRLPDHWNGKLVITGAPGIRRQYSNDFLISDWVLARGYAYASTDKGNSGTNFFRDGATPADAIAEWHQRVNELTLAAKEVVKQRYGQYPTHTYMTGISNGGYLTRFALENYPDLYDGGVDWEGVNWQVEGPNLMTYLPTALKYYPGYAATRDPALAQKMYDVGFAEGSEFIWEHHYLVYWDLTQRVYREEVDPTWDGSIEAGFPFCQSGTAYCDADYEWAPRPQQVKDNIKKIALTGKIGKPMLTLHGTLDSLVPISVNSDNYAEMIKSQGKANRHRYYIVDKGNHVDNLYDEFPDKLRPILPCYRAAFVALEQWVEYKQKPPESRKILKEESADPANECRL